MKSSIIPLSEVLPEQVYRYFERQGFSRETVRWKYFDEEFNGGRERGYAWLTKDGVKGFIGMIPATVATPAGDRPMVWTCDWAVDNPQTSPGIGMRLIAKVHKNYDFVAGVGGSEFTHAIIPRMDTLTVPDAAVFLHLPLRLGTLLKKLEARVGFLPRLSRTPLRNLPLPRKKIRGRGSARIADGVAGSLAGLFDAPASGHCRVRYDQAFLEWVGRSPGLRALSCYSSETKPSAAALFWCSRNDPRVWRIAFRSEPGARDHLQSVLSDAAQRVFEEGGAILSAIVSHLDTSELELLKENGFVEGSVRWPLYIPAKAEPSPRIEDLAQLSYLDTDLAAHF